MQFSSRRQDWYLVKGAGPRQWFSDSRLETVLGMAILMTGMGGLSGADEVTVEDSAKVPIVTFVANEAHAGCHMVIPVDAVTTEADLEDLEQFMVEHQLVQRPIVDKA